MKKYSQPDISVLEMQLDVICASIDPSKGDIFSDYSLSQEGN